MARDLPPRVAAGLAGESDDGLMERVAEGDRAAFELLAGRHARRALGFAQRLVGNASDAEELVQEALLRAWLHADRWDPARGRFATWFYRILTNLCLDRRRRPNLTVAADLEQPADPAPGPHALAEGRQIAAAIAAAIDDLPERQRAALTLCYYQDMSCSEAASVLSITVSAMEALLVRGRRTLREALRRLELDLPEAAR